MTELSPTPLTEDDTMTEENQRRASPELEAAANAATRSPISNKVLAEFATHPGLIGLLARELQQARRVLAEQKQLVEGLWPVRDDLQWLLDNYDEHGFLSDWKLREHIAAINVAIAAVLTKQQPKEQQ